MRDKMIRHWIHHDSQTKIFIEGDVKGYIGRGRRRKQIIIDKGKDCCKELK